MYFLWQINKLKLKLKTRGRTNNRNNATPGQKTITIANKQNNYELTKPTTINLVANDLNFLWSLFVTFNVFKL